MKRTFILIVFLLLTGITVFAQSPDMSFYTEEFNRSGISVFELQNILQAVSDQNLKGIGAFYYDAINTFIRRLPDFQNNSDRVAVEGTSRLLIRGLAAEKYTQSAQFIWYLLQYFDIASPINDGYLMYEAFVALGQIGAKNYATVIAGLLEFYNERASSPEATRILMQRVAPGAISALKDLCEPIGVKPVLIASTGWFDNSIKTVASDALIYMMEELGEVIADIVNGIMHDPFNSITIKSKCWNELLRSNAPDKAKAEVAVTALEESYRSHGVTLEIRNMEKSMRETAIDTIRLLGVADNSVYPYIERTYREALETVNVDMPTIMQVVSTLSAVKTDEAVDLLTEFLRGIHTRRASGPWRQDYERIIMRALTEAIAYTGTSASRPIQLLTIIQGSSIYTGAEQAWARSALTILRQ